MTLKDELDRQKANLQDSLGRLNAETNDSVEWLNAFFHNSVWRRSSKRRDTSERL